MSLRSILFATIIGATGISIAQAQESDLFISKSGPSTAAADTDVSFTITITNFGPDPSATVTLTDIVAGGWSFVSVTQNSGPPFSCSDPGAGATTGMVSCTAPTMLAGSAAVFTIIFHIPPGTPAGTAFTNVASVSSPTDPNDENNASAATTSTPPPPQADLGVTKNGPPSASPDNDVTYTITVTNGGPDPAIDVVLNDTLPGTMTFVSLNQNSGPAMSCSTGTTITCTATTFPAGGAAVFTLVGHIPAGTSSGTVFTNTATVASKTSDPNPDNGTSSALLTVQTADVSVTKSGPATANAGTNVTYIITVTNGGPDAADGVSMSDDLPPGSTFVSLTQDTGDATTCNTPPPGSGGTVTCGFLSPMNAATSAQFTLVTTIGPGPSVNNTATVTSSSGDPDSSDNSATVTTSVTTLVDVSVTKNGPPTANSGTNITYTIAVNNAGPSPAPSTTLTDNVPANTTFVSLNQSGPLFSCSTPGAGGTGTISCSNASFPAGSPTTFTLVVNVNPSTPAATVITNTANVSSGGTDANNGNNTATATTTTGAAPTDTGIVKTAAPGLRATGQPITYNITVTNNGPTFAFGVTVTDILTGVTFGSATPSQGSCSGTTTIICTLGTLAPSTTATIALNATLGPTPGPVSNTATVTISNGDTNPANNSSTVLVTVIDSALIPTLSPSALAMLALAMAALALLALRR
ncbi:MAG: IPTL-CTERM sorting domain-containing protein [Acidobacteriota bacterium]